MASQDLKAKIQTAGEWSIYFLSGSIGDNAEVLLDSISDRKEPNIIFDFSGTVSINSMGVADWLEFLQSKPENQNIVYDNCPPHIVEALNMILGFSTNVNVRSILIPYICQQCQKEWLVQYEVKADIMPAETATCPQCSKQGSSDVELDDYLFFALGDHT